MKNVKNIVAVTLGASFILCNTTRAQEGSLDYSTVIDGMNELSKSAVYIVTRQHYGTGTLFTVPFSDTGDAGAVYVATARHVLWKTDSAGKVIGTYDTATVFLPIKNGVKEGRKYCAVLYPDSVDIAILAPIENLRPFREYDVNAMSTKQIATFSEVERGQLAFLAGYPFGIGGSTGRRLSAVIQSGITAYVDTTSSLVLVDIPVNQGNSGCPVYIVTKAGRARLLGLVFEYEPSREDVVYRVSIGKAAPVNSSLGRVVLLRSIIEKLARLPH